MEHSDEPAMKIYDLLCINILLFIANGQTDSSMDKYAEYIHAR